MEETISLAEYILNTLNKQIPSKTEKQWNAAITFFLLENTIRIFETDEFTKEELECKGEEKTETGKNSTLLLKHQGEEYKIKIKDAKITLIASRTLPFFEIAMENTTIKNKRLTYQENEITLEEEEICFSPTLYRYKKQKITNFYRDRQSLCLVPINTAYKDLEYFELINEFETKEKSAYWIERIIENIKGTQIRKISLGEDETTNFAEIFACLESECDKKDYERKLDRNT